MIYKVIVQAVIFYGSEIWVVIDSIMTILEVFYHRVTIWIPVITACRGDSGEW